MPNLITEVNDNIDGNGVSIRPLEEYDMGEDSPMRPLKAKKPVLGEEEAQTPKTN